MSLSKNEKELLRRLGLGKENAKPTKEIIRGLPITERGARDILALYESELLDYAERLLSDDPLIADSETAIGTLDMLDDEAIDLFKSVDIDNEYQGLEYYNTNLNKED